jgi:3-hydroxyisobutyrate dehydrogenase
MNILVAGCGAMGLPMALALREAGFKTWGFDTRLRTAHAESGLTMLDQPAGIGADVLLIVVRDNHQIKALCFDDQALFAKPSYPHTVIVSSTISVPDLKSLAQDLPDDVVLVDAPMSGAPIAAAERRLTFMLGGPSTTLDKLMPLFEAMGSNCFRLGEPGRGMLVKTLNNTVAVTTVVAIRRVLAEAAHAGLDAETLLSVMSKSSGATWFGNNIAAIDWAGEIYSSNNTIGILEKDLQCAIDGLHRDTDALDQALLEALRTLPAVEL